MFIAINNVFGVQSRQHSDAILIILTTIFSVFILFYDFWSRLPTSKIIAPVLAFVLINLIAVILIYVAGVSFSGGVIIPAFMVEGAVMYWLLEKRISTLNDEKQGRQEN